jgi:hypothetical protein
MWGALQRATVVSKNKSPSEKRSDKRYWRTKSNQVAQISWEVRKEQQREKWVNKNDTR